MPGPNIKPGHDEQQRRCSAPAFSPRAHCRRKGSVLAALPGDAFHLERGEGQTTIYKFNTHKIEHHTCPTCGCTPFARGAGRDGKPMVMVNLRCAEDVDLSKLKITAFDGASM
jgi:hypothetical protein